MPAEHAPGIGEHVGVPWGLDTLEGQVISTYQSAAGVRVVVNVTVPGTVSTETVTLRASDLRPLSLETQPPGSWYGEYQYGREAGSALQRVASRLPSAPTVVVNTRVRSHEADAVIDAGRRLVVVEIKRTASGASAADQLRAYIDRMRHDDPERTTIGMIVLQSASREIMERIERRGIIVVKWRGSKDDQSLAQALTDALQPG